MSWKMGHRKINLRNVQSAIQRNNRPLETTRNKSKVQINAQVPPYDPSTMRCLILARLQTQIFLKNKATYHIMQTSSCVQICVQCAMYTEFRIGRCLIRSHSYQTEKKQTHEWINVVSYCERVHDNAKTLTCKQTTKSRTQYSDGESHWCPWILLRWCS